MSDRPTPASSNPLNVPAGELLAKLTALPPFNSTAIRLLALASDEDIDFRKVEDSVRSDPSLAGQLLVVANSALFGHRSEIATVRQALTTVGLDMFRQIVATVATSSYMQALPTDWVKPLWIHAVATAVIAEYLAQRSDRAVASLMYTAGLLHDLGRLGILSTERQAYRQFLATEYVDLADSQQRERESFGMTHTQAGYFLMQAWGFPEVLCGHARDHHDPAAKGRHFVHDACVLADRLGYPELSLQKALETDAAAGDGVHLDDADREEVVRKIEEMLRATPGSSGF